MKPALIWKKNSPKKTESNKNEFFEMTREGRFVQPERPVTPTAFGKRALLAAFISSLVQVSLIALINSGSNSEVGSAEVSILLTRHKIDRSKILTREDFTTESITVNQITHFYLTPENLEEVIGKTAEHFIPAGSPISREILKNEFSQRSVPERIPAGKRLFVLRAELGELSQVLKAGDKVDVIAELSLPEQDMVTKTLLSNVKLIGIAPAQDENHSEFQDSISLHVTSQEAEFLTFAQNHAKFSVVLRNPEDETLQNQASGVSLKTFQGASKIQDSKENVDKKDGRKKNERGSPRVRTGSF